MKQNRFFPSLIIASVFILGSLLAGCSTGQGAEDTGGIAMASLDDMPVKVQSAPASVREAYQFAVANPETLKQIPCYCGCGAVGHASNYACYVSAVADDGAISYDAHALGCSICVDIAVDTRRMLEQGQPIDQIRAAIDQTYAQYGPSNIP